MADILQLFFILNVAYSFCSADVWCASNPRRCQVNVCSRNERCFQRVQLKYSLGKCGCLKCNSIRKSWFNGNGLYHNEAMLVRTPLRNHLTGNSLIFQLWCNSCSAYFTTAGMSLCIKRGHFWVMRGAESTCLSGRMKRKPWPARIIEW